MKLICERDALHRAISAVVGRARGKTKIAILQHLKLETDRNQLLITATDLDTRAEASCPAEIDTHGARCVLAERLAQIISGMAGGAQVEIQLKDSELHVRSGQSRYRLPTLEAADFPSAWEARSPVEFSLPCLGVKALFGEPQVAIVIDGSRRMLEGGCLYQPCRNQLAIVATDGTKFVRRSVKFHEFNGRYIIPRAAMTEIVKISHEGDIDFVCAENLIQARAGSITFTSKLIEATYPDVERIIVDPNPQFALIDRKEMASAVKRLMAVEQESGRLRLSWGPGQSLELSLSGAGHGQELLNCECDLDAGTMLFSPSLLDQMLGVFGGDVLQLHLFPGSSKPLRIIDPADDDLLVMVMPCRDSARVAPTPQEATEDA